MANRKGVSTSVILAIGLVVLTAIVLLVGVRIISPKIFSEPAYVAKELALSMDAVYASPEDAEYIIKFPKKVREDCFVTFGLHGNNEAQVCQDITAKFTKIDKPDEDEDIVYSCDQIFSVYDCMIMNPNKLKMKKEYDETTAQRKRMRVTSF